MILRTIGYSLASWISLLVLFSSPLSAAGKLRFERDADTLYLSCVDVAQAMGYEFKVVQPRRLVTFCRGGAEGICIPMRLSSENHRGDDNSMMVSSVALGKALSFTVVAVGDTVAITQSPLAAVGNEREEPPAYNATWSKGRGFRKGETLPDIPLVDLKGDEVRFSQFLGKRYILYCWASW